MGTQRSAFLEQEQKQKQEQERRKITANPVHHTLEGQVDQLKIMAGVWPIYVWPIYIRKQWLLYSGKIGFN